MLAYEPTCQHCCMMHSFVAMHTFRSSTRDLWALNGMNADVPAVPGLECVPCCAETAVGGWLVSGYSIEASKHAVMHAMPWTHSSRLVALLAAAAGRSFRAGTALPQQDAAAAPACLEVAWLDLSCVVVVLADLSTLSRLSATSSNLMACAALAVRPAAPSRSCLRLRRPATRLLELVDCAGAVLTGWRAAAAHSCSSCERRAASWLLDVVARAGAVLAGWPAAVRHRCSM